MIYKGYEISNVGGQQVLIDAPCGCQACVEQVQSGHWLCFVHPRNLKDDPKLDFVYLNGSWVWVIENV